MLDKNIKFVDNFRENNCFALGRQLTIEYYKCGANAFLDEREVETALLKAAKESGATIISSSFHKFEPQGISGVVLIAESHFTVHAWPEHDYAAVDIFTCADNIDLEVAMNSMKESFKSERVVISSDQNRGIISKPFEQKKSGQLIQQSQLCPISWKREYEQKKPWGMLTCVDIYKTDPRMIRDSESIEQFVYELCDLTHMERSMECRIIHLGEDKNAGGFSMTQHIGTSLISGHFDNTANTAYLDVLSCKFYEPRQVAEFALSFFKGDHYKMQVSIRQ